MPGGVFWRTFLLLTLLTTPSRSALVQAITNAAPRITDSTASSVGGTNAEYPIPPATTTITGALVPDLDRLYTTVDEYAFAPSYATSGTPPARTPQSFFSSGTTEVPTLEECRFFLTASSKAPELNLFHLPRVAIWPVWDDKFGSSRTAFDQAIMRCATVANGRTLSGTNVEHKMIFSRENAASPTADFAATASLANPNLAATEPRNQEVYQYLQALTSKAVPGYGGYFTQATKYGVSGRDQILTEIFDYIRCVNLADNSTFTTVSGGTGTALAYTAPIVAPTGQPSNEVSTGQVVPIQITTAAGNATQGFGRINVVSQLGLALVKIDDRIHTNQAESSSNRVSTTPGTKCYYVANSVAADPGWSAANSPFDPSAKTLVEWTLLPQIDSVMCGYVGIANNLRIKFTSINLSIGGTTITGTAGTYPDLYDTGRMGSARDGEMGGYSGMMDLTDGGSNGAPVDSMYPTGLVLVSGTNATEGGSGTIAISGTVSIEIDAPAGTAAAPGPKMQTVTFTFPSITTPIPKLYIDSGGTPATDTTPAIPATYVWNGCFRSKTTGNGNGYTPGTAPTYTTTLFNYPSLKSSKNYSSYERLCGNVYYFLNGSTDVTRSLVATGTMASGAKIQGDLRMVAATQSVGATAFALDNVNGSTPASSSAPTSTTFAANSLRNGTLFSYGSYGSLYGGTNNMAGDVPSGVCPALMGGSGSIPGDWDNGPGIIGDGPWINKPDEGGVAISCGGTPAGFYIPYIGSYETASMEGVPPATLFSPNRQISSPVMFGSLPAGLTTAWRTLLFRPANLF